MRPEIKRHNRFHVRGGGKTGHFPLIASGTANRQSAFIFPDPQAAAERMGVNRQRRSKHSGSHILKLIDATIGLRVPQKAEIEGLDLSQHGRVLNVAFDDVATAALRCRFRNLA